MAEFWDRRRTQAAQYVAENELNDEEIATKLKRSRTWLHNLKHDDRFTARVKFLSEQLLAEVAGRGIVERRNRVDELNKRADELRARKKLLESVIAERADNAERLLEARREQWEAMTEDQRKQTHWLMDVPGATTGLLARGVKGVSRTIIETWELDAPLLAEIRAIDAELRAHEKQAAQELGQWSEKRELTGKNNGPLVLIREVHEHDDGHVPLG